jgi:hypothetical protein
MERTPEPPDDRLKEELRIMKQAKRVLFIAKKKV